jgi:hypothetical protein
MRNAPNDVVLQKCWMGAVLPLVTDRESTVQDATLDYIVELVLEPMAYAIKYGRSFSCSPPFLFFSSKTLL